LSPSRFPFDFQSASPVAGLDVGKVVKDSLQIGFERLDLLRREAFRSERRRSIYPIASSRSSMLVRVDLPNCVFFANSWMAMPSFCHRANMILPWAGLISMPDSLSLR
jgi:hypothetical protein